MDVRNGISLWGRTVGIGELAVTAVFVALVSAWVAMQYWPSAEIPRDIFLAGFVGGFTNSVAIRMLFARYWYLPGSGVLLKEKDAIILSLADTVETHILNPELVEVKVREISNNIDRAQIVNGVNAVIDEMRPDLIEFVSAPEQRQRIRATLRQEGGFWGGMANSFGVMTYSEVTDRLVAGLTLQIESFQVEEPMVDAAMERIGSIDDFVLQPENPLLIKHYGTDKSLAQVLFDTLDLKQLVIDRLSAYDAAEIRDIIAENTREHLAWLEVFGVILGMAFATVATAVDALL